MVLVDVWMISYECGYWVLAMGTKSLGTDGGPFWPELSVCRKILPIN